MASILQLEIQLLIAQKLLYFANQSNDSQRMLELNGLCLILRDTIIETQKREINILEEKLSKVS